MLQSDLSISSNGKKTNSLAFCRTDCHTCVSLSQDCDRRRPQCSTCLSQGRKCGGFATPLSWATQRMWTDDPSAKEGAGENAVQSAPSKRQFRFVMGASKPRKRRKAPSASQRENALTSRSAFEDRPSSPDGATTREDLQLPNNYQTAITTHPPDELVNHALTVPSPNPTTFLGDDLNLFDSFVPSSFSPVPLEISNNMMTLSSTPPFNAMETTEENPPDSRDQPDPLMPDQSSILQSNISNPTRNDVRIHEINMPYASSPNNALGLSNIFRNDHDNLLQMCMICLASLKRLRLTRAQMIPSSVSFR